MLDEGVAQLASRLHPVDTLQEQHVGGYTASQALVTVLQAPVVAAVGAQIVHIDRELAKLAAADTRPKVVITAVMRKLLLLAWTLVRTGQRFSPTHHLQLAGA